MNRLAAVVSLALLAAAAGFGVARWRQAHGPHAHHGPHAPEAGVLQCTCCKDPHFHRLLGLSPEQASALTQLDDAFNLQSAALSTTLSAARGRLADLISQVPPGDAQLETTLKHISSLQMDLERLVVSHLYDIRGHLTPAQQAQFMDVVLSDLGRPMPEPAR